MENPILLITQIADDKHMMHVNVECMKAEQSNISTSIYIFAQHVHTEHVFIAGLEWMLPSSPVQNVRNSKTKAQMQTMQEAGSKDQTFNINTSKKTCENR